jgi:SAM-dependent methyltransferase
VIKRGAERNRIKKNLIRKKNPWEEKIEARSEELHRIYIEKNLYPDDLGVWSQKHLQGIDLSFFRADNVYVWQTRNVKAENYLVSYLLTKIEDDANLFGLLHEDGNFGANTFEFMGITISRDLLDSILEINFLIKMIGRDTLSRSKVLDIGAGYGRLAKNLAKVFPDISIGCIDSIPISTAISEFYLKDEIASKQIEILDLTRINSIAENNYDLAVNIHSFSEMSLASVENWIKVLDEAEIQRVFVVPNPKDLKLNSGEDFSSIFLKYGYSIETRTDKYPSGIPEQHLLYAASYFYLVRK